MNDTVKPRFMQAGADCGCVIFIDESDKGLLLSNFRIEQAIIQMGVKLFILDLLQAYLGVDVDMRWVNEIRPILKRIGAIAEQTGCAIVVIGHMNKGTNKSQYRGLAVSTFRRRVPFLTVGRVKGKPNLRAMAQGKNNLILEGKTIGFELDPNTGFRWAGVLGMTIDELLSGVMPERNTTYDKAVDFIKAELADSDKLAAVLFEKAEPLSIHERTLKKAKFALAVGSFRKEKRWYWVALPSAEDG